MAKKNSKRQPPNLGQRFMSLERLVRTGFRQTNARFRSFQKHTDTKFGTVHFELRNLRKEMNERFAAVDDRIDRLAGHVDGFMKLHETMDIEMQVMKEQMKRFEERLKRLEGVQLS